MYKICLSLLFLLVTVPARPSDAVDEPPLFTLDDRLWVMFYDLPSRRFREIRDAFIRRDFDVVRQDLTTSEAFLRAEIGRADPVLVPAMTEVADRLHAIADNLGDRDTTVTDLDPVFARAHWLLAQHYLTLATTARDTGRHKMAGQYLWATAHHLERTVLWSDARISRKLVNALDGMREMAGELRTSERPERVYKDKPIDNARRTLFELGEFLDRKVWISPVRR
jgi:hypothetical protein